MMLNEAREYKQTCLQWEKVSVCMTVYLCVLYRYVTCESLIEKNYVGVAVRRLGSY